MRTIFAKLTLWFFITLALSLSTLALIVSFAFPRRIDPKRMFESARQLQFEMAVQALETRDKGALRAYLHRLDTLFPGRHHLLDAASRDTLTGADLSAARRTGFVAAANSRFVLLVTDAQQVEPLTFLPYYLVSVLLVALMAWVFTRHLARPLLHLRETVRHFGAGNLALRTRSRRRDEIGDLARDFDAMADRIETLLTAERRLLQDVSHEVRTPLARLSLAIELGRQDAARLEITRLSTLIGELTEMTRAEGDPTHYRREPFDLTALLDSLAARYEVQAEIQRGLTIPGREEHLRRAVENILDNAVHHTPQGTVVHLSGWKDAGQVFIRVRDFGPGVPESALQDLFRPFFRVETDRSRQSGGVGLGLAIAHRAVRLHEGEIIARNSFPGLEVNIRLSI